MLNDHWGRNLPSLSLPTSGRGSVSTRMTIMYDEYSRAWLYSTHPQHEAVYCEGFGASRPRDCGVKRPIEKDQKKLSHDRAPQAQSLAVHVAVYNLGVFSARNSIFLKKNRNGGGEGTTSTMLANSKVIKMSRQRGREVTDVDW